MISVLSVPPWLTMNLIAYELDTPAEVDKWRLEPAPRDRDWMNAGDRAPYRCRLRLARS